MDPNTTYDEFLNALKEGDPGKACEAADALGDWFNKDGAYPKKFTSKKFGRKLLAELFNATSIVLHLAQKEIYPGD